MADTRAFRAVAAAIGALALGAFPTVAQEQAANYPSRNITLIVPQAAGGPPDVVARLVATPLAELLGKPVIVENRAGASASLGAAAVAKATPDGYTLLFTDITVVVAPSLIARVAYDPVKDLAPVSAIARSWLTMVVANKVPATGLKEFIALAKAKPGEMKFASSGIGSPPHLVGLAFLQATGTDMAHVPYRGTAPAVTDVVGGHIETLFVSFATAEAQANARQVRIMAVSGPVRFPSLPAVPTFKELGIDLKGVDDGVWFGITAPAATPPAIVKKLNSAINQVLSDPQPKGRIEKANFQAEGGEPAVLGKLISEHTGYWSRLLKTSGIVPKDQ